MKKKDYKYQGILEADTNKQTEMKKVRKEYTKRTKKLLEIRVYNRNLLKRINTWGNPLLPYKIFLIILKMDTE